MRPFRFIAEPGDVADGPALADAARRAEGIGYAAMVYPDHLVLPLGFVQLLTWAAAVLLPACLLADAPLQATPSTASLLALLVNAVFGTALAFVLYFRLIRTIGSVGVASVGYLKPCVGVLVGCSLFGEPLTWSLGLGLGAIVAAFRENDERFRSRVARTVFDETGFEFRQHRRRVLAPGSYRDHDGKALRAIRILQECLERRQCRLAELAKKLDRLATDFLDRFGG